MQVWSVIVPGSTVLVPLCVILIIARIARDQQGYTSCGKIRVALAVIMCL